MNILKLGKSVGGMAYVFTCQDCDSTIEALENEGDIDYFTHHANTVTFECPVCGNDNVINRSYTPLRNKGYSNDV